MDIANIELTESQGFVNDLSQPLAKLVEKDVRIILASFNATWARRVFCQVSRINLYGERYQWIIAGPRQERWWNEEDPSVNCTQAQILAALEGAFVVDVLPLTSSKQVTISGLVRSIKNQDYSIILPSLIITRVSRWNEAWRCFVRRQFILLPVASTCPSVFFHESLIHLFDGVHHFYKKATPRISILAPSRCPKWMNQGREREREGRKQRHWSIGRWGARVPTRSHQLGACSLKTCSRALSQWKFIDAHLPTPTDVYVCAYVGIVDEGDDGAIHPIHPGGGISGRH